MKVPNVSQVNTENPATAIAGLKVRETIVGARHRAKALRFTPLMGSVSVLALAAMLTAGAPDSARADNECGTASSPYVNTCSSASYPSGITYTGVDGLQLELKNSSMVVGDPGVSVETSSGSTNGVNVDAFGFSSITTSTDNASGISVIGNGPGYVSVQVVSALGFTVGDITTTGDNAHGVYAEYTDTTTPAYLSSAGVSFSGGDITTSGQDSYGLYALNAGLGQSYAAWSQLDPTVTVTTAGYWGLLAETTNTANTGGVSVQAAGGVINSIGSGSTFQGGMMAKNVGLGKTFAQVSGTEINTNSDYGFGAASLTDNVNNTEDTTVQTFGGSVTTTGDGAHALYAASNGTGAVRVVLNDGTIQTSGANAYGMFANGTGTSSTTGSVVQVNGGTVTVSGTDSFAVSAYSPGRVAALSLSKGSIVATGDAQAAIGFASGTPVATNAAITIGSGMTVDASGTATNYAIWNDDDRAATNIVVTTSGTVTGDAMLGGGTSTFTLKGGSHTGNIYGDYDEFNGSPSDTTNQGADAFVWTGGSLNSGFYGQGGDDTATISVGTTGTNFSAALFDGGLGTDTITFLNTTNDGVVGANITDWEKFVVDGADIAFIDSALTLNGYTGSANGVGDFTVQNSGRAVTNTSAGDFTLTGNLFLADAASTFLSRGTGTTSITGDVTNSGILSMQDGQYGGDVTIGGNYTSTGGSLGIDVDFGALQSDVVTFGGAINGVTSIQIADIGASSTAGAILIADTTTATSIDQNEFTIGGGASGIYAYGLLYNLTGDPSIGTTPGLYLYAGGGNLQPYIPLYEAFQSVVLDMNKLPTMRQRVGKGYWVGGVIQPGSLGDEGEAQPAENTWLRIVGNFNHQDPKAAVTGYDYDVTSVEVQAGFDGLFYDGTSGRLVAGPTLRYVNGHAKIDSAYGSSAINPHGYGVGGTLTWYGSDGFYTDAQAEVTWYESQLKADDLANGVNDVDALGYALSAEVGQQMGGYNGMILTPQAQLYYSSVDIDSFTGAYSDDVVFNKGESLLARVGLALEQQSQWLDATGNPKRGNVYAIANIYHEFLNETTATVEQAFALSSKVAPWTGEIGFGGTYGWDADGQSYALYGEARASTGLDNFAGAYGYAANGGVKVRW